MKDNCKEIDNKIIKEFEEKYPYKTVKDLTIEIEKISDMLLGNEESNRYTYWLQEKATSDKKLDKIRNLLPSSINFLDYKNNKLKVQLNFLNQNKEYTLIMYLDIVARGRVFLKKYRTMKRIVKEGL